MASSAQDDEQENAFSESHSIASLVFGDKIEHSDEISCVAVHAHSLVFGTRKGLVVKTLPSGGQSVILARHDSSIYCVSLDSDGRHCASGSADGRIMVTGDRGQPWAIECQSLVLSLALCPEYGCTSSLQQETRAVCLGTEDGRLLLHKKGVFGAQHMIHAGEGPVRRVCWRGQLIAWANDKGVKVLNLISNQKVTFIARPPSVDVNCKSSLLWAFDDRLLCAWGPTVKIAIMVEQPEKGPGSYRAEVRHQFTLKEQICGLAPIGEKNLAVLTASPRDLGSAMVILCNSTGDIFHSEELPLATSHYAGIHGLHIGYFAAHLPLFLCTPKEVLHYQVKDLLEYAAGLLDRGHYDKVVNLANIGGDSVPGLRHFACSKAVVAELRKRAFEQACDRICSFRGLDATTWQECIHLFEEFNGLQYLAASIPVPGQGQNGQCQNLRLPNEVYDSVLHRLVSSPRCLLTVLKFWPPDIFSVPDLQARLREKLGDGLASATLDEDDRCRAQSLALLYDAAGDSVSAVYLFLQLLDPEIFRLLTADMADKRTLASFVEDNVAKLFVIDDKKACTLLVDNYAAVPAKQVVHALQGEAADASKTGRWRHLYLKQLFEKDPSACSGFDMLMVMLFAEYEPDKLLDFLKASERYPLEDALGVCQGRGFHNEEAYLLGKAGNTEAALNIYLDTMNDVEGAVKFASEYTDPKLWQILVDNVVKDKPDLLVKLLDCLEDLASQDSVGHDSGRQAQPHTATPAYVLKNLPSETPVSKVARSIYRVFESEKRHVGLHESCAKMAQEEMLQSKKSFFESHQRGTAINPSKWLCSYCSKGLSTIPPAEKADAASSSPSQSSGIVLIGRKTFHLQCHDKWSRQQKPKTESTASWGRGQIFPGAGGTSMSGYP